MDECLVHWGPHVVFVEKICRYLSADKMVLIFCFEENESCCRNEDETRHLVFLMYKLVHP